MYMYVFSLVKKSKLIYIQSNLLIVHKALSGSMVVVCLVQRLLEELKQSNPLKCDWNIFKFDYSCLHFIIIDDQMQL